MSDFNVIQTQATFDQLFGDGQLGTGRVSESNSSQYSLYYGRQGTHPNMN